MKGVLQEVGSHPRTTSFRVRPSVPTLTLQRESVEELQRHLNDTITLVLTAKQVYNSAGTIIAITTGDNSPLLMLSTNLRTGVMRLKYRVIGGRSLNEVLTISPFAETDLQEWANVGIVLSGRRMRIYEGCDRVRDITLQDGVIDLSMPNDALVYVTQGVKGKNKFSVSF